MSDLTVSKICQTNQNTRLLMKRAILYIGILYFPLLQILHGLPNTAKEAPVIQQPYKVEPLSKVQILQRNRGYGMFIHFGINTFNQTEWSNGTLPVSSYNPTQLDCDQWIRIAKEAGFRYVILTAKHHDGFCLWDSKLTTYDVASSPVKTDVVAEVAKACKKYDIKLGIYYSLWDQNHPSQRGRPAEDLVKDTKETLASKANYRKFMLAQLTELMTNYGDICELWLDGGWHWQNDDWDIPKLYSTVRELQPECSISVNHSIRVPKGSLRSIRQPVDMKKGDPIRYWPLDVRLKDPALARWDDPQLYSLGKQLKRLPFEHTICISELWNWFQKDGMRPVRSLDELEQLFYWTTHNDNTLIVNIPPARDGRIREHEAERIISLADRLGIRNGAPLPTAPTNLIFNTETKATSNASNKHNQAKAVDYSLETYWQAAANLASLEIKPKAPITLDQVIIHESSVKAKQGDKFSFKHTFHIEEFRLEFLQQGQWRTYYVGSTIKHAKRIDFADPITCDAIRLVITKASGPARIAHIACTQRSSQKLRPLYKVPEK